MKKLNNKGLSLIEMMIVVAMVAAIAALGGISASKLSEKSKIKKEEAFVQQIKNAASTYANIKDLRDECADIANCVKSITVLDLINAGLIKSDLIDPFTEAKVETNLVVVISWDENIKSVFFDP